MVHALVELLQWIPMGLPAFLFVISIVVFFHELGHFGVARACGVAVETFSIGFGPAIFGWTDKKGTYWKVSWVPLGGYVKFAGDADAASTPDREKIAAMSAEERAHLFQEKPLWQRAAVVAAGPVANFVLAIVIFAGTYMLVGQQMLRPVVGSVTPHSAAAAAGIKPGDKIRTIGGAQISSFSDVQSIASINAGEPLKIMVVRAGKPLTLTATPKLEAVTDRFGNKEKVGSLGIGPRLTPVVGAVTPGSAAEAAGLKPGDTITAIDNVPINDFSDLQKAVAGNAGKPLTLAILRDGKTLSVIATPRMGKARDFAGHERQQGVLGIASAISGSEVEIVHYGLFAAVGEATSQTWFVVHSTMTYLWRMVAGQADASQLSGVVGIARVSGQVATIGILALINLAALISVSIGLVNLFPVPILDGGHLLYYGFEAVLGRPLGARAQDVGFRVGLAVMLGLMVLATWNDLVRLNLF
jgi:regulator of sigma E protease